MKSIKIEIKWAFIFIGSLLLWMLLERLVGLHDKHIDKQQYITILYAIVAIALYVFTLLEKRNNHYHGTMTYQQGFVSGLVITLIVTICSPLTQFIIATIITPEYFNNIAQHAVETGHYKNIAFAKAQFNLQNYMVQSTVSALGMGLVTTAIVALFTRTKQPNG